MLVRFVCLAVLLAACTSDTRSDDADKLVITPVSLPSGNTAAPYVATLNVSGGSNGYQWSLESGEMPPGVVGIPASGASATLNGTPSEAGSFEFTVRVRDSEGATGTRAYRLVVASGGPGPGEISLVDAPSPRGQHTAVWTGTEMIIWGGVDNTVGPLDTGAAYDPMTDSWRTIPTTGAPSARLGHTAVWTGSEMIVWGGWDGAGPLGTGGAYDPAMDRWRPLTTSGAPLRRGLHTAVWTGQRMLIWGGQGVFPPPEPNSVDRVFGDGAAYDPAADFWSPIATGGPPARGHTAVWTGSRMVAWGGRDSFALALTTLNIGGVYNPSADSWTFTTLAGVPAARVEHTAVWSGTEMIVWGGRTDAATDLASGGRYSPATDVWVATATAGAPSARRGHTAVWTGTEMIVWGGVTGPTLLGTGAIYDPAGDSWRSLPASFAPTPRTEHSAVAAGPQMTVWGGRTDPPVTYVNTGATYWLFQLLVER